VVLPTLRFARLYREHAIGLVHHNNCFQAASEHALAAVLTGIPCLSHQRIRSDQLPPLTLLTRFTSRLVKAVICVSEHVRESVVRGGFPAERCCVIHDGLDGSAFRARIWRTPAEVRAEFGLPLGAPIILMVGNIKAWKGQMTVVKAAALLKDRYPEAVTIFVGDVSKSPLDAPYLAALRGEAAASGIEGRVIFTGYRRDVAELMNACDVLVHASRWPEPFGMTVLEAMALAKPVVASGLGGPAETIEDGVSGLLFPPKDPAALARAIDSVLADPELAERLGQAASERLERHFSLDSHVAKVERLYEAVLAGGAAQAAAQQAAAWQPVKR
jgi:glycosyltransferase involved in cell wall biosynthesis